MKRLIMFFLLSAVVALGQTMDWDLLVGKHIAVPQTPLYEPGTQQVISLDYAGKQATIIAVKADARPSGLAAQEGAALDTATVTMELDDGTKIDTRIAAMPRFLSSYSDSHGNQTTATILPSSGAPLRPTGSEAGPSWLYISEKFRSLYNWVQMTGVVILSALLGWFLVRVYKRKIGPAAQLVRVLALQVGVIGICVGIDSLLDTRYPMIFALVSTGIVTFYALLLHCIDLTPDGRLRDADIRMAIALSITLTYLALVGYGIFFGEEKMGELSRTLISSFSTVVGVVITFYFGTSAYVETRRTTTLRNQPSDTGLDKGQTSDTGQEKGPQERVAA